MHIMFWILLFYLMTPVFIIAYVGLCTSFLMVVFYIVQLCHSLIILFFARYLGGIQWILSIILLWVFLFIHITPMDRCFVREDASKRNFQIPGYAFSCNCQVPIQKIFTSFFSHQQRVNVLPSPNLCQYLILIFRYSFNIHFAGYRQSGTSFNSSVGCLNSMNCLYIYSTHFSYFILKTATLWRRYYYYPYYTAKELNIQ